VIIDKRSIGLL